MISSYEAIIGKLIENDEIPKDVREKLQIAKSKIEEEEDIFYSDT